MSERFVSLARPPAEADAAGQVRWIVVRQGEVLTTDGGEFPLGTAAEVAGTSAEEPVFVGLLGPVALWAVGVGAGAEAPAGMRFDSLRALGGRLPDGPWALAGRAVQLVEWDRTHRFCGRCASPTVPSPGERAKRCPACGLLAFPRLAPAVIALVERAGEVLLANGRSFGAPVYSCLAGFVEPGETLEEAVHREVAEEVGVQLGQVSYFGSQPWPFPNSLMIGFNATWLAGEITIDQEEIVDAAWFRADAMPSISPRLSIARWLIDDWLVRQGAG